MKNLCYYMSIISIGILLPFIVVIVCKKTNYENELIVPIISSVTFTMVIKAILDSRNSKKDNNSKPVMKNTTNTDGSFNEVHSGNYYIGSDGNG